MNRQVVILIGLAVVPWVGIPWAWMAARHPRKSRISMALWGILTNLGPLIMVVPWIVMPLLAQPLSEGSKGQPGLGG